MPDGDLTTRPPLPARRSLRWRLPLQIVGLVVGVLAAFVWAAYAQMERTLSDVGLARAQGATDQLVGLLAPASQQRQVEMAKLAADPAVRASLLVTNDEAQEAARTRLRALVSSGRQVTEIWNRDGVRVLSLSTPANTEQTFPPSTAPTDVRLRLAKAEGSLVVADIIEPIPSADGSNRAGYLVMRRPVATSSPETLNKLVGSGARIHLGGGQGQWTDLTALIVPTPLERSLRPGAGEFHTADGEARFGAVSEIQGTPWLVAVDFPRAAFLTPATTFLYRTAGAALVLALIAGFVCRLSISRITTPLAELTDASEAIASGDFSKRVDSERPDELGRLGSAFNAMVTEIQEAHEHLMLAVRGSKVGIWEWNVIEDRMYLSPQYRSMLGFGDDELQGGRAVVRALIHPDDYERVSAGVQACLSGKTATWECEYRLRRKDETYVWVLSNAVPSRDAEEQVIRFAGTSVDTTTQRHIREEALAQARQAAFVADVAVAMTERGDPRTVLARCAQAMVHHLDAGIARIWTAAITEPVLELQATAASGGLTIDTTLARVNIGTSTVGRVAAERCVIVDNNVDVDRYRTEGILNPEGLTSYVGLPLVVGEKLVGTISMFGRKPISDSTIRSLESVARTMALGIERQRQDESRSRFEDLLESATDFVTIGQLAGPPLYVNRAAREALEIEPAEQVPSLFAFRPRGYEGVFNNTVLPAVLRDGVWRGRSDYVSRSGRIIPVSQVSIIHANATGNVQYLSTISRDISDELAAAYDREKLEEQLGRAQRIEAIGQLAGGLAHDFNNLLTIILGFANVLGAEFDAGDARRADVEQIQRAGERAAQLTRQLLAFSRKQVLSPVILDPNALIADIGPMLSRLLGESIELVINCDPDVSAIRFDPSQLELILVNLVANARDAMPSGGRVTIETADADLDQEFCRTHLSVEPGRYVRLSVIDTGTGIDDETKKRIFEPFFTTKGRDKGTGLGLATVHGIVKQSGGSVWVYSEPGLGASFKIFLPATSDAKPLPVARTVNEIPTGSETVLVVEDEAGVRVLVESVLSRAGYAVILAGHPAEAVQIAADAERHIDLLITDVVMPDLNGAALARELCRARPSLRVLFMSGFADDAIEHHGVEAAGGTFLQKPFTSSDLARKVRDLLDGRSQGLSSTAS